MGRPIADRPSSLKRKGKNAMIEWVSKKGCREKVAEVPDNWLVRFAANQPNDIRKFGDARNSTLLFRTAAVLAAVEDGKYFQSSVEEAARKAVGQ
jgi:hypothetical protein